MKKTLIEKTSDKLVEARKLAFRYAQDKFEVGAMNSFDFTQAKQRYELAQSELIRTKYDYIFKLKVLEFYFGVPIIIGVQWILLTFITGSFSAYIFKKSKIKAVFLGAILMVLLDILIEPVAPDMGFWVFNSLKAPVQNYIAWFVIGIPVQILFHNGIDKKEQTFSFHLLIIQFLFFGLINILAL